MVHEEGGDFVSSTHLVSAFLTLGIAGNAEDTAGEEEGFIRSMGLKMSQPHMKQLAEAPKQESGKKPCARSGRCGLKTIRLMLSEEIMRLTLTGIKERGRPKVIDNQLDANGSTGED